MERVVPHSAPVPQVLDSVRAAQAKDRRPAGSAWRQADFVFTIEFGEACDSRNAFRELEIATTMLAYPTQGCTASPIRKPA